MLPWGTCDSKVLKGGTVTWPGGGQLHGTDRDVGPSMNTVL